jgi:hypothetical protein
MENSPGPSPDCLDPDDIARLTSSEADEQEWVDARLAHVERCKDCAALLWASQPSDESLGKILAVVRERSTRPLVMAGNEQISGRGLAGQALVGPGILSALLVATWVWATRTPWNVTSDLARVIGSVTLASIVLALSVAGLAPQVARLLGARQSLAWLQGYSGILAGGIGVLCTAVILGTGYYGYHERQLALPLQARLQTAALQALAYQHTTGKTLDVSDRVPQVLKVTNAMNGYIDYEYPGASTASDNARMIARIGPANGELLSLTPGVRPQRTVQFYVGRVIVSQRAHLAIRTSNGDSVWFSNPSGALALKVGEYAVTAADAQGRLVDFVPLVKSP